MAVKYGKKKFKQNNIIYTVVAVVLLLAFFLYLVSYVYTSARDEAYETLHVQTKQIKDDITLQLISDRENLSTMANFAANLYNEDKRYDIMFESFKPIGLIENIGILNKDNTFVTKAGVMHVEELSFETEAAKGAYISSRVSDITTRGKEIVRSSVPIVANGETVGVLYGVIQLDKIAERYNTMAKDLGAQLFVYSRETGDLIIDTVHRDLGNISILKDREYNENYSYEEFVSTDKGFLSFMSAYKPENLHLHYSTIDDIGWMIALGRYDSEVFAQTHKLSQTIFYVFVFMISVIAFYIVTLMVSEKRMNAIISCASDIRKTLLESSSHNNHIAEALKQVCLFVKARSSVFFDTDSDDYSYISPEYEETALKEDERKYFQSELFKYAAEYHNINALAVTIMCITPNRHLVKTNPEFYNFLKEHNIKNVSFSATINNSNHITILAVINTKRAKAALILAEKISACFSIALNNKNHLSRTTLAATTDSLTGALNRVAYKADLPVFDEGKFLNFSCIYVDVNELHICNNKYGHAAGDEMLLYIANTLKEVFYGHKVYRMGGDEFLVFCEEVEQKEIKNKLELFLELLKPRNYHVATGMSFRTQNTDTESMVKEAEVRMYEAKAEYYQSKDQNSDIFYNKEYYQIKTGIREIDTMISVLKEKYNGIYRVSLDTDKASRILMPAYLNYNEDEEHFSGLFSKYVSELVNPDYHRALLNFLNYDALKRQLSEGKTPKITYKKNNSETVNLSVYKLSDTEGIVFDTLWVFAKE